MENISPQRILQVLSELGIQHSPPNSTGWVKLKCLLPGHNDSSPSAGINIETGKYHCYVCGSTNIYKIVQQYKSCTYKEAKDYIDLDSDMGGLPTLNLYNRYINKKENIIKKEKNYKLDVLYPLLPDLYEYTKIRGFTKNFCDTFNIKYCNKGYIFTNEDEEGKYKKIPINGYMIIPLKENVFEARKISGEEWTPKVLYPTGAIINDILFNINNLDFNKDLIISEGTGSIPKIYESISKNVTCTFGSKITEEQLLLLKQFKGKKIFLSDWDKASITSFIEVRKYLTDCWVFKERTDDKDEDFILKLEEGYIEISRFLSNFLYKGDTYEG